MGSPLLTAEGIVTERSSMAESCGTTRGAGNNRAFQDAANSRIGGELQDVESDLPEDIMNRAMSCFNAAISDKCTIQQAIEKVQKMVCPDPFMGKLADPNMNKK